MMICIDGAVGIGKSSLASLLSKELDLHLLEEPVVNNPFLDIYYENPKRWSFPTQIFFLNERFKLVQEAEKIDCILDRSIYGDEIFAKMLKDDGKMTEIEFNTYKDLLNNMLQFVKKPDLMVYIYTDEISQIDNNIKNRGRDYEMDVPLSYWSELDKYYKDFFKEYDKSRLLPINVTGMDFVNREGDFKWIKDLIIKELEFIKNN